MISRILSFFGIYPSPNKISSKKKFAFFPTYIANDDETFTKIWLKTYYEKKMYLEFVPGVPDLGGMWLMCRTLKEIKEPPKLKLIKNDNGE